MSRRRSCDAQRRRAITETRDWSEVDRWTDLLYRYTQDNSLITYGVEPDGRIRFARGPGMAIFGGEDAEAGRSMFDVYRDSPDVLAALRRALNGDSSVANLEIQGRTLQVWYVPFEERGKGYSLLGIAPDITEKLATAERQMLHAEALAATAHAIVITDTNGTIEWVNPAFTALTGYAYKDAVGRNPRDLVKSGMQSSAFYANLWRTITAGKVWTGRLINKRADGSMYHEFQTITPVKNDHDEVTHFIAVKIDVTKEVELERQLNDAQRRDNAILSAIPELMFRARRDGTVLEYYPPRNVELPIDFAGFVGRNAMEFMDPNDARAALAAAEQALSKGITTTFDAAITGINGEQFFFHANIAALSQDEVLVVGRDVTEAHRHVIEMEQRVRELTALNSLFVQHLEERSRMMGTIEATQAELISISTTCDALVRRLNDPDADRISANLTLLIRRMVDQISAAQQHDREQRERFGLTER